MKNLSKRIFQVFLGSFIAALGIQLFLYGQLGVDPISTLLLGVMVHVPLKFGTASQLFNVLILLAVFLLDKKKIGLGSVINGLSVGFFVNLLAGLQIETLFFDHPYFNGILGPVCLGIGTGVYLYADLGCGALEGLMLIISEKTSRRIKYVRMVLDFILVVGGILLGSLYGVGTLLGILFIGPTIELTISFLSYLNRQKNKDRDGLANE